MNTSKTILLVLGVIILIASIGLLIVGLVLYGANTSLYDSQGFLSTADQKFTSASYAIAAQNISMNVDTGIWNQTTGDLVTIKITASSNNAKNVFIGVANKDNAQTYLNNVQYDEIKKFNFNPATTAAIQFTSHQGSAPANPLSQTFWIASAHGAGTQTLQWSPQTGDYWIILMNEDASTGIDDTVRLGAKVPLLSTIGAWLLIAGVVALVVAIIMLYFGIRR